MSQVREGGDITGKGGCRNHRINYLNVDLPSNRQH